MNVLVGALMFGGCLGLIVWIVLKGRKSRMDVRIDELTGHAGPQAQTTPSTSIARSALPKVGTLIEPTSEEERSVLKTRLMQAGYYTPRAMQVYLGAKVMLMVGPAVLGLMIGGFGLVPIGVTVLAGGCLGIVGMIGPSFWLDHAKSHRHLALRRALPDALDLLVICLEGGLTLQSGMKRISEELKTAHPDLARELLIVQRGVQLGLPESEAMAQMGSRTDLEEIRSLAAVITQTEKFGASLVQALRIHSQSLRQLRRQRAEEMAQKAGTKVLFPTLIFIFPAIFVVILGPAFFQIMRVMSSLSV